MLRNVFLFSGTSAVGKTAVLKHVLPALGRAGAAPCICKIDCLQTQDGTAFRALNMPYVVGLAGDICPDHFMVSNLPELRQWAVRSACDTLVIETAGLCHRCSPATEQMTAGCVIDCSTSSKAPAQLGPMLTQADFAVLTKIDLISQAECEIFLWKLKQLNPSAALFPVDALAGYGIESLCRWLTGRPDLVPAGCDRLRAAMPSAVCSYCVGEQRVGSEYQQGVTAKINFEENR